MGPEDSNEQRRASNGCGHAAPANGDLKPAIVRLAVFMFCRMCEAMPKIWSAEFKDTEQDGALGLDAKVFSHCLGQYCRDQYRPLREAHHCIERTLPFPDIFNQLKIATVLVWHINFSVF
jgi:hypothetical protein